MNTTVKKRIPNTTRPISILLAEDDYEMRKLLALSLEKKGYEVDECADGTSLLKKLGFLGPDGPRRTHDLVVSDIRMPGMTGLQVLESAREFPDFPPVILITAFPDEERRLQARRLGASALIAKPFDIDELLDKIIEIMPPDTTARKTASAPAEAGDSLPFPFETTFRHHHGSTAVSDYMRDIAAKLTPFADHIVNCRLVVDESDPNERKKHRYTLSLVLSTPGKPIVVKHSTDQGVDKENLFVAAHVVFGTACRKLKHYVEKRQGHRKHTAPRKPVEMPEEAPDDNFSGLEAL